VVVVVVVIIVVAEIKHLEDLDLPLVHFNHSKWSRSRPPQKDGGRNCNRPLGPLLERVVVVVEMSLVCCGMSKKIACFFLQQP